MANYDIFHVAIVPPKTLDADLVKKVAAIIGKEPFDMRILLGGEIPRIIAHYPSTEAAQSTVQSMRGLGLEAFACTDSELRQRPVRFLAHTIKFGDGEATFSDKSGKLEMIAASNIFLIMKGKRQSLTQETTTTTKMKLSVPATVLTGGIPVIRPVKQQTTQESLQTEDFLRLYDRESSNPLVEIFQNHFDCTCLGDQMATSTPTNFSIVITRLRELFSQAHFDDRLNRTFKVDIPSVSLEDALEINCKLIHFQYLMTSGAPHTH